MNITEIEIRACRADEHALESEEMRFSTVSELEFLVLSARTDEGIRADTFGFAGTSARASARVAAEALKPFFLGKDPLNREKHYHEFRMADRWWHHVPIYAYGPFDILCWLLGARQAGQPLHKYIGSYRDRVPVYGSSLVLSSPEEYADQASKLKQRGWAAYKVHPEGDASADQRVYERCREAVGSDFTLMADPVAAYNHQQALRVGRRLEQLGYHWLEEPLFDVDLHGLRKLTRRLDIPICGTEVLKGDHYAAADCIASNTVDIVRSDVSWKGGVTVVMKMAHLAESFGVQCELHTAIFHPLELINLHCCAALKNGEFFELLLPRATFDFGLEEPIQIKQGHAVLPEGPGRGIALDRDFVEDCTLEVF